MGFAVAPESSRTAVPGTPYKGLTPYGEGDAALFFGRDVWSDIVTDNVKAYRLTLLYGESGVGKSSVLRAGVAHRLREQANRGRETDGAPGLGVVVFSSWRGDVEQALVEALDAAAEAAGAASGQARDIEATLEAAVERCAGRCGGRVFLILDQFEEYFVYHPTSTEGGFDAALPRALRRRELPLNVLISIREDAVARLDRFKSRIPNLFDNYLRLDHLDRAAAREAIERPLERVGGVARIEPELVEAVLDEVQVGTLEVAQGGAMRIGGSGLEVETPYLQLVMTRLWAEEQRAGSDVLRLSTLNELGGAQGIVSTHLGDALASLPPDQRDIAARVFRYLVTRSRSKIAHSVSDLADWTDVSPEEMGAVLERLCSGDARILRPVGESSYEIYHDVLADAILAWRAAHEAERRVEEEKRLGELATRRRIRRLALAVGLLAATVVVLVALFAYANHQRERADHLRHVALSGEFASNSVAQGGTDADVAIALALAAWKEWPNAANVQALEALRAVLASAPIRPPTTLATEGPSNAFVQATYSTNGERILTTSDRGPPELWDAATARRISTLTGNGGRIPRDAVFSANGERIATGSRNQAEMWRAADGSLISSVATPGGAADGSLISSVATPGSSGHTIALNHDGTLVAAPLRRGGIGVWSAGSSMRLGRFGSRARYFSVRFTSRRDRLIAYYLGRSREAVDIWSVSGGRRVGRIDSERFFPVTVSADGLRALVEGRDGARLINVRTGRPVGTRNERSHRFSSAQFAANGPYLLTTDGPDAVMWDATTGEKVGEHRFGGSLQYGTPANDGTKAVIVLSNGDLRLWDRGRGGSAPITQAPLFDRIETVQISADTMQALTAGSASKPAVWDLRDVGTPSVVVGGESSLSDLAVDPRGPVIATGDAKGAVRLWDRRSGKEIGALQAGRKKVKTVAFDRDGGRLAAASADGTGTVWDVKTQRPLAVFHIGARLTDLALDPGGHRIATTDTRGRLVVRTIDGGRPTVIRASTRPLLSVQFSPDGSTLVTASGRNARIWDATAGELRERLDAKKKFRRGFGTVPYPGAFFSPDGHHVAMVGTDGGLRLWDEKGTLLRELQASAHGRIINHAAFSRDGSLIAAGGDDAAVHVIDGRTGADAVRLAAGPEEEIARVGFSPDGSKVTGLSADGVSYLWDVRSRSRLEAVQGHVPTGFYFAGFSPDGTQILASDGDNHVELRPCLGCLSRRQLASLVRAAAHRQLTAAERQKWLHQDVH